MDGSLSKDSQPELNLFSSKKKDLTSERNRLIRLVNKAEQLNIVTPQEYFHARNDIDSNGADAITRWENLIKARLSDTDLEEKSKHEIAIIEEINEQENDIAQPVIGYAPRAIILATLPRSKPNALEFKRSSGNFTLLLHVPNELHKATGISLPYGPLPRLIFLWLATEIKKASESIIHLGDTRSEFMRKVGITPRTGKRGNMKSFEQQFKNLLGSTFSAWRTGGEGEGQSNHMSLHHRFIASDAELWWDHSERATFNATLNLDDKFYQEMKIGGIPIDLNTIAALKDNSLALDIYVWLTYRFATLPQARKLPWEWIFDQFASGEYADTPLGRKNFKAFFLKNMKVVLTHYTEANIQSVRGGLMLHPSPSHIPLIT